MLMDFEYLKKKYGINPTGIIHCGGSHAEELEAYMRNGIKDMIWVEAIPAIFKKMKQRLLNNDALGAIPVNACLSDEDGKQVDFFVTSNEGQSSSFLKLKDHKKYHPDVVVKETISLSTKKLDTIIKELEVDVKDYNFLNMDLQGAELLALRGMEKNLPKVNFAYIEVNDQELYEGCAMENDVTAFLKSFGLEKMEVKWTECHWGDAFYKRK